MTPALRSLPPWERLRILFAHPAYQVAERFAARGTGITHIGVRTAEDLAAELPRADVLVVSQMWRNTLVEQAPRLALIQAISAGHDQFDLALLRAQGIRLATAAGVTAEAVAQHAMALILALARHLHTARDDQARRHWRGMIAHIPARQDQLDGRTLLIVGLGRIGERLARLGKAFGMRVVGTRRDPLRGAAGADAVFGHGELRALLRATDVVALTCPLTDETRGLIGVAELAAMRPTAHLVNVSRGAVVDEIALIEALRNGQLGAVALDVLREEPPPVDSPLWVMPNVLITSHKAGETQRLEDGVIDILLDNLDRLWRGEMMLRNGLV